MGITQKEIAKNLGISFATVSRALNGSGYVSDELKQKIFTYAKEHEYVPHKASQVLVRNTIKRISVYSSPLPQYFWDDIGKGIGIAAEQLRPFNYEITYHRIPEHDTETYLRLLKKDIKQGVDGIALVVQRKFDMNAILGCIKESGIPFVTFNTDDPDCGRFCYIGTDYSAGGRLAADFIGKSLLLSPEKNALVIQCDEQDEVVSPSPDINDMRLKGFKEVMDTRYPEVMYTIELIDTKLQEPEHDTQIFEILKRYRHTVQAIYLVPAFNVDFIAALDALSIRNIITVLHDLDGSAGSDLQTGQLSAVIYQNPVLQGYCTIKALEQILENKTPKPIPDTEIVHTLVLAENRDLIKPQNALRAII